jgi:hypothetical protein
MAHVHFAFRGDSSQFAEFVSMLAGELKGKFPADNEYRFALEWMPGAERPLGAILARQEIVRTLAKAITAIAVSSARTSQSQRGIRGTRLRNSTDHRSRQRSVR